MLFLNTRKKWQKKQKQRRGNKLLEKRRGKCGTLMIIVFVGSAGASPLKQKKYVIPAVN